MKTTRMLIATLCLALAACAGSIDEPGEGADDNAADDSTDVPDDSTDNTDDGNPPPAPTFTATVYPIVQNCTVCHQPDGVAALLDMTGSAEEAHTRIMSKEGVVNLDNPTGSKLFAKPTGSVQHGGGALFAVDSNQANAIKAWIEGGAAL